MNNWTKEVPTKEGFYWFYGYPFGYWRGKPDKDERLIVVEVHKTLKDFTYVGLGTFLFPYSKEQPMIGYWSVITPAPTTDGLKF